MERSRRTEAKRSGWGKGLVVVAIVYGIFAMVGYGGRNGWIFILPGILLVAISYGAFKKGRAVQREELHETLMEDQLCEREPVHAAMHRAKESAYASGAADLHTELQCGRAEELLSLFQAGIMERDEYQERLKELKERQD